MNIDVDAISLLISSTLVVVVVAVVFVASSLFWIINKTAVKTIKKILAPNPNNLIE
jgi:hypothetical protein